MKRFLALLCAAALLLLGGCVDVNDAEAVAGLSALDVAETIAARQGGLPALTEALTYGDAGFRDMVKGYYAVTWSNVADGAILLAGGVEATEIVVLRLIDNRTAEYAVNGLERYRTGRASAFTGYAPEQEAMVNASRTVRRVEWVALLICPDPETAAEDFRDVLKGTLAVETLPPRPTETPEPTPYPTPAPTPEPTPEPSPQPVDDDPYTTGPEYDHDAVLSAWQTGDASALSERNRAIYEKASAVLSEVVREDMSDYEKELAVHDWMIDNAEYDPGELNHAPGGPAPEPDHNNPYGLMLRGKGICVGYSSTFQLFMDMLGIECITVRGTANEGGPGNEHAWNMVRLDGEWYCVDVTWDDPVGSLFVSTGAHHRYFNVTSDFLRSHVHYWDESTAPEATATAWAWKSIL